MSFRTRILSILDVVLRVPPVFIMDTILMNGFSDVRLLNANYNDTSVWKSSVSGNSTRSVLYDEYDDDILTLNLNGASIGWILIYLHAFIGAFFMFFLSTRNLLSIYVWIASIGVILWSYICNEEFNKFVFTIRERESTLIYELISFNLSAIIRVIGNYILQVFLAIIFCFSNTSSQSFLPKRFVGLSFITPTIVALLPSVPLFIIAILPMISAAVSFLYIILNFISRAKQIFQTVYDDVKWSRTIVRHYGLYTLLENQWARLHVPQVLRVFWLTRLTEQAVFLIADRTHNQYISDGIVSLAMESHVLLAGAKQLLIRGCETIVAVLGMTSVLSGFSHQIGCLMQSFLLVEDPEDRSIGTVSAILFFILALQTGLTGMEPEKRFLRLYRNLCLLFTAILHFIHNMVSPLLFSLSASRNMSLNRHGRALTVCMFLIAFPIWFLSYLWTHHGVSTWLLAVSAFSIEVVIKVIISLLIYTLFMIDAFRTSMWEKLDDYVYYIRATGNTIEFIFGIFLFFNGAWILMFESGGTIRALMMCIHAYFNIWLQAKAGWRTFIKRRHAVYKINSLPEATEEQLMRFDDVCAICYQELTSARITKCKHYFHGVCLRKWLYVQDICPLCHETLYNISENNDESDDGHQIRENELHPHND